MRKFTQKSKNHFKKNAATIFHPFSIYKKILLVAFLFLLKSSVFAQYNTVVVTGYNFDIIANGVGNASASTNNDLGSSRALVSADFKAVAGNAAPAYSLPATGIVASIATAGLNFQLASYSTNNSLRLATINQSGLLTFTTPAAATTIYLLATAGEYDATIDVKVNFNDATSQTFTAIVIKDWYDVTTTNRATNGIGRINTSGNGLEGDANNPHFYQLPLALDAGNFTKQITGILVTKTDATVLVYPAVGGGIATILAVSIKTNNNCVAPAAQPTTLLLTPTSTTVSAIYNAAASTDKYLVLRTPGSATPTLPPVNGTAYTVGATLGNATVVSIAATAAFTDASLAANTTYRYTVYGYNDVSCTTTAYNTTAPLSATTTTLQATNYTTAVVTGFNFDIIANGVGNASALTTNDLGSSRALVSADYKAVAGNAAPAYALPASGLINSAATAGLGFQLASYTGNNALRLQTQLQSGTLTLATPKAAKDIFLLATAGEYDATIDVKVNFSDATSETFTGTIIKDWYDVTATNLATTGVGRINTSGNGLEGDATNPHFYQLPFTLSTANQAKQIASILITKTDATVLVYPAVGGGIAAILAVSLNSPAVMPIKLSKFTGYKKDKANVLNWTTLSETNNTGFEVQRSTNAIDFSTINFVATKANQGNSNAELSYEIPDFSLVQPSNYYRLKQIDKDGKSSFSNIILLKGDKTGKVEIAAIYPNPSVNALHLVLSSIDKEQCTLIVTDINGRTLLSEKYNLNEGVNTTAVDVTKLIAGTYFIKAFFTKTGESAVAKFVKQ